MVFNLEFCLYRHAESLKPHFRSSKWTGLEIKNRFVMRVISILKLLYHLRQHMMRLQFSECIWRILTSHLSD
jgi:hypothetical protein